MTKTASCNLNALIWILEGNEREIRFYTRFEYRFDGKKQEFQLGTAVTEVRMILKLNFHPEIWDALFSLEFFPVKCYNAIAICS